MPVFPLPRIDLPEFGDAVWLPSWMCTCHRQCLELMLRAGGYYKGAVRLYADWARTSERVLDLGSGAGGAITIMLDEPHEDLRLPCIVLSDIQPQCDLYRHLQLRHGPQRIAYRSEPVAAQTAILEHGASYSVCSAFHHLPPEAAAQVIQAIIHTKSRLLILEPFTRNGSTILQMVLLTPVAILLGMTLPFRRGCWSWKAFLCCTLLPIVPLMVHIDGIISVLRTYAASDVLALLPPDLHCRVQKPDLQSASYVRLNWLAISGV